MPGRAQGVRCDGGRDVQPPLHRLREGRALRRGARLALVGSVDLQKMLYDEDKPDKISDPEAGKIDAEIAFYVGPEDTVADIVKEIFG